MKKLYLIVATIIMVQSDCFSQFNHRGLHEDTIHHKLSIQSINPQVERKYEWKRAITAPLFLTAAGIYATSDNEFMTNEEVHEERNEHIPTYRHRADDYLQFAPIVAVYGLDAFGVKAKTDFANRTMILLKTELILAAITFPMKKLTAIARPDSGQPTSFPSGHTAQAFAAATFMAKEYGDKSPWYSIGAYSVATTVGVMRMMNNRHWLSDVFVGAGVGIFSTNLAYLTHRYKWGKRRVMKSTLVIPSYDGITGMLSVVHKF